MESETVATLSMRRDAELRRRLAAVSAITREMAEYADRNQGRFVLFGSYVSGRFGPDSDLDVLVLFPDERQLDAILFLERLGDRWRMPIDILDGRVCAEDFINKTMAAGVVPR